MATELEFAELKFAAVATELELAELKFAAVVLELDFLIEFLGLSPFPVFSWVFWINGWMDGFNSILYHTNCLHE